MTYNPQCTLGAVQNLIPFNALTLNSSIRDDYYDRPFVTPISVPGYIAAKTVEHYVSFNSTTGTQLMSASWALYSLKTNGSQWGSVLSTSHSWNVSQSQLNGLLLNQVTAWGTYTLTPGVWGVAAWGFGYGDPMTKQNYANYGNSQYNGTKRLVMANGVSATSSIPTDMLRPLMGVYSAVTLAAPATIDITELTYYSASAEYVVPYVGIRMAT